VATTRRIRTILYGDQQIESTELELLHTPALQRLYDLHQLGLTDRIFIDASHSRLQHVVGVLQQVDNIIEAIAGNLARRSGRRLEYRSPSGEITKVLGRDLANQVRQRRRAARLMGLLHDLTHAPFGHTLEDEIELQPQKHDEPDRQADAFYRLLCQYIGWLSIDSREDGFVFSKPAAKTEVRTDPSSPAEQLATWLDAHAMSAPPKTQEFIDYLAALAAPLIDGQHPSRAISRAPRSQEIVQLLRDLRFAMRALLWLDALHKDHLDGVTPDSRHEKRILNEGEYPFEKLIDRILESTGEPTGSPQEQFLLQRDAYLLDVIGNTICADLLDYAKRDSHFAGLKLDYDVDRIVENFTIVSYRRNRTRASKSKTDYGTLEPVLRTAISIFSHKLRIDVPGELMNLLQVRFYVYQRVLFHPTKCIAGAMLGSALQLTGWKQLPLQYRFVGDAVFLHEVREVTRLVREIIRSVTDSAVGNAAGRPLSEFLPQLKTLLSSIPSTSVTSAAADLLEVRSSELLSVIQTDLDASIRLLDRLSARRYHRPIFRLLPNVAIEGLGLNAENVAAFFLKPINRSSAEREIERRARLPHGTVTIHCPSGEGPKKIAEILILSEKKNGERALLLRDIGGVDSKIFAKHETAIQALEEMYASMWRLVVSVAPPFHLQHSDINREISRVLFAALRREPYDSIYDDRDDLVKTDSPALGVPNDETMVLELEAASSADADAVPTVRLIFDDGREEMRSEAFIAVAEHAVSRLQDSSLAIKGFVKSGRWAANEPREVTLASAVSEAIPVPTPDSRPAASALGEGPTRRSKRKPPEESLELLREQKGEEGPRAKGQEGEAPEEDPL
jgi:HD superfamily phosphohydrolase